MIPEVLISPLVGMALNATKDKIASVATSTTKKIWDEICIGLEKGFSEYLNTSLLRCKYYKTILSSEPIEITDGYIPLFFDKNDKKISDKVLTDNIYKNNLNIIVGGAGSGKSMFMKNFVISNFVAHNRPVPLFVEMRKLNDAAGVDLIRFLRTAGGTAGNILSETQFALVLEKGLFVLVLDGFDELKLDIQQLVQSQISSVIEKFPKTKIVMTSRPDDRLTNWPIAHIFRVLPLNEEQIIKIIGKMKYDEGIKTRFVQETSKNLLKTHRSFLSSPLLISIMLFVFEEFATTPNKMHLFYSQAFDVLFQRHDAWKEQYKRDRHTKLSLDEFKFIFAAFCMRSYLDQRFSFSQDQIENYARDAIKMSKTYVRDTPPIDDFINDLHVSVCLLAKEGIYWVFVHRSFQEYFAAYFITQMSGEYARNILNHIAKRFFDAALPMAFDMRPHVVGREWVIPALEMCLDILDKSSTSAPNGFRLTINHSNESIHITHKEWNSVFFSSMINLGRIFGGNILKYTQILFFRPVPISKLYEKIISSKAMPPAEKAIWLDMISTQKSSTEDDREDAHFTRDIEINSIYLPDPLELSSYINKISELLKQTKRDFEISLRDSEIMLPADNKN